MFSEAADRHTYTYPGPFCACFIIYNIFLSLHRLCGPIPATYIFSNKTRNDEVVLVNDGDHKRLFIYGSFEVN